MPLRLTQNVEPIPGYTLIERLGSGGFGEVWKARAPGGIPKAIKFVHGNLDEQKGNVPAEQELKALTRVKSVRHPFILGLERVDVIDGQVIIVMELADRSIWDRFKECQNQGLPGIPRPELLRYMNEAAEALDLMNGEYQLQHLDIKPQNLFLVRNHIKVADFGLVKDLDGRSATVTSGITPVYAAPETFEGRVSHFSDQYSLAIVYQELLTGHRPFDGKNARQLLLQHVTQRPNLSALPLGDRHAIDRSLAKSPDDRYPTCSELVLELRQATDIELPSDLPPASSEFHPEEERNPGPRGFLLSSLNTPGAGATPADPDPTKTQFRRPTRATLADFDPAAAAGESPELWPTERNRPSLYPSAPAPRPREPEVDPELLLQTSTSLPERPTTPPCPRCGAPLLASGPAAWCGSCGYCNDIDETPAKGKNGRPHAGLKPKPAPGAMIFPMWAGVMLIGMVVASCLTLAADRYYPPNTLERAICSTAGFGVGVLCLLSAPFVALRIIREYYGSVGGWNPAHIAKLTISLLPETRWVVWLATWGPSLMLCGLLLGGYEFWWNNPNETTKPIDPALVRALQKKERERADALVAVRTFRPIDMGSDPRKLPSGSEDRRPVITGAIVGVIRDDLHPGRFTRLLVSIYKDGAIVGEQVVDVQGMKEDKHDYINSHFAEIQAAERPLLWDGKAPSDTLWLKAGKLGCEIRFERQDDKGYLVLPSIERLLSGF